MDDDVDDSGIAQFFLLAAILDPLCWISIMSDECQNWVQINQNQKPNAKMILNCTYYWKNVKHFPVKRRFEQRIQNLATHALKMVDKKRQCYKQKTVVLKWFHINVTKINEVPVLVKWF